MAYTTFLHNTTRPNLLSIYQTGCIFSVTIKPISLFIETVWKNKHLIQFEGNIAKHSIMVDLTQNILQILTS